MDSHFLTDIDIIDFKCFQNFSAKGFKRVNLIGGKNNIGKTVFMEAFAINVAAVGINSMVGAIIHVKIMREKLNLIAKELSEKKVKKYLDFTKHYHVKSNIKFQEFNVIEQNGKKEYHFKINEELTIINANELNDDLPEDDLENIVFLDSVGTSDKMLCELFQAIQELDKEFKLNQIVNQFDKEVINFKVIGKKPVCKSKDQYRDIVEFGDGLRHYISIICSLYACQNGYLFIDEIDNGIYFEQFDRLWEIILTISKETNCQVFATTHSKEMIESFARVSQKLNEQDVSYTTLVKNDKNEVKALVQDYEMFMYSMNFEHEVR